MAIPRCIVKWRPSELRGSKSKWIHNNLTTNLLPWVTKVIMPPCGQKGKYDEIIWCGYRKHIFPPQSGWMPVQKYCNVWKAPASLSDGNVWGFWSFRSTLGERDPKPTWHTSHVFSARNCSDYAMKGQFSYNFWPRLKFTCQESNWNSPIRVTVPRRLHHCRFLRLEYTKLPLWKTPARNQCWLYSPVILFQHMRHGSSVIMSSLCNRIR